MKVKLEKEFDLKLLIIKAGVRYWEDAEVNGKKDTENGDNIPCKIGNFWCPQIVIDTGKILNWEQGVSASVYYKVCDCLDYEIQAENFEIILSAKDVYVPNTLCPKDEGFGDYIKMDIDENGIIANWKFFIFDFKI